MKGRIVEVAAEVQDLIARLSAENPAGQLAAAVELGRLGVRTQKTPDATRGTPSQPAEARLSQDQLAAVLAALRDSRAVMRREVAFALGEWGGLSVVGPVAELAEEDPDVQVQVAAIGALTRIGGKQAVAHLEYNANRAIDEDVRAVALSGLASLAYAQQQMEAGSRQPTSGEEGQTEYQVIVTQAPGVPGILALLQARSSADTSPYVRMIASSARAALTKANTPA